MKLATFHVLTQIGLGPDGPRFEARDETNGRLVELRVLSAVREQPERWKALTRRLRLASLAPHFALLPIHFLDLEHDPPFMVTDPLPGPALARCPAGQLPWKEEQVRVALRRLASALQAGHRLGLAHEQLSPWTVFGTCPEDLRLDLSGAQIDFLPTEEDAQTLDAACRAPEGRSGKPLEPASDLFSLGVLCGWLWRGQLLPPDWKEEETATGSLASLLAALLVSDPAERPLAQDLVFDLMDGAEFRTGHTGASQENVLATQEMAGLPTGRIDRAFPGRLGRFRIEGILGEGGLGRVFRGTDIADGTVAAIKILHAHLAARPQIVQRFHKEARLLAEINNPFIVNLLENNQDEGVHYLALEFIDGPSLFQLLRDRSACPEGRLPEPLALAVALDVSRALVDAHRRGIVHRDIKPQNILVRRDSNFLPKLKESLGGAATGANALPAPGSVKLCDFGLARHIVESDSLHLTQEGTAVGTPLYMSPEQASGRDIVRPATDVYSLGATLYHLLAGRPPFGGETALALSLMHANEAPPPLRKFNPSVSEGVCRLIERCLAKKPEDRPGDGAELLEELERLVRGEPAAIGLHPHLPKAERGVREYVWTWELRASPEQLWPFVSNTERLNRAAGIPAVQFTTQVSGSRVDNGLLPLPERQGTFRKAGVTNTWREHPFEWIEGRRLGVLREYTKGVFKWLASTTTLEPLPAGGTRLTHQVRVEPSGFLGKLVCAVEVGFKGRRALERVYRRIDDYLTGNLEGGGMIDAFEQPPGLARAQRRRLTQLLDRLTQNQVPPDVVQALESFILNASDQEAARIRPLALARNLEVDPIALTGACLIGAREGLFTILWDILCPLCRIPSGMVETLKSLKDHGHCEACQADFPVDFASSVELIFRVHPSVRSVETRTYCVGGPAHSPHVAAQVRLARGETFRLDLSLEEGAYRLRGPQLPRAIDFLVDARSVLSLLPVNIPEDFSRDIPTEPFRLQPGRQRLALTNLHSAEVLLRVERTGRRADALTAARASSLALFRQLFPGELLEAGRLVSVAAITFLAIDLGRAAALNQAGNLYELLGEARTFSLLQDFLHEGDQLAHDHSGAVIKTLGDSMLLAFDDRRAGVRAGLDLFAKALPRLTQRWAEASALLPQLRALLHHGPALAATVNDRLDYFGTTLQQTLDMLRLAEGRTLTLTSALASDPEVMALLHDQLPANQMEVADIAGPGAGLCLKVRWPAS